MKATKLTFTTIGIDRHRMRVDGQGVTTLVGLAGCPLQCSYCLNKRELAHNKRTLYTPEELWQQLSIDYCYFVATKGGVTFGGGESLLHYREILAFSKVIPEGVSINLETSLNVPTENLKEILQVSKQLIIDIKDMNPSIYQKYTGLSNSQVIENLEYIANLGLQERCRIRIPLIPHYNSHEDQEKSAELLRNMGYNDLELFDYITERKTDGKEKR